MASISGRSTWWPLFCPIAVCFPCIVVGKIESLLANESGVRCCCINVCLPGLGPYGLCCCVCSGMLNCCLPFPFSPALAGYVLIQRHQIMDKFNIDDGCVETSKGCCCPCALFQHYVFLEEIRRRRCYESSNDSVSLDSGLIDVPTRGVIKSYDPPA